MGVADFGMIPSTAQASTELSLNKFFRKSGSTVRTGMIGTKGPERDPAKFFLGEILPDGYLVTGTGT
jgi:hypothetical protein